MIDLRPSIAAIETLLRDGSEASLNYAALECRLAIERICYERLRIAHDYISHDDLKRWQPRDIVNVLIQQVDANIASTFTLSISKEPSEKPFSPTVQDYREMEFVPIGVQVGFNPTELGRLWNALANLALHISIPDSKDASVPHYGDPKKVREKVREALEEIKRIGAGTLLSSGFGEEVSFDCFCGVKNKRRLALLKNGQIISCISPQCDESYEFEQSTLSFARRTFAIVCQNCGHERRIPIRVMDSLKTDQHLHFDCEGCQETIYLVWRATQAQKSRPKSQ